MAKMHRFRWRNQNDASSTRNDAALSAAGYEIALVRPARQSPESASNLRASLIDSTFIRAPCQAGPTYRSPALIRVPSGTWTWSTTTAPAPTKQWAPIVTHPQIVQLGDRNVLLPMVESWLITAPGHTTTASPHFAR